jgi:hypothetical protein
MLTRSVIVATTLTVGLVAGVGSSALAVAFVPGNESGSKQSVQAIADAGQDPAEGASSSFVNGIPAIVTLPPVALDGVEDQTVPDAEAATEVRTDDPSPTPSASETPSEGSGASNSATGSENSGNGNSGSGDSEQSAADKAAQKQAKKDQKAAEEKAKKDKKAAEEQAKKDKKAAEEQAKKDKKDKKDESESDEELDD